MTSLEPKKILVTGASGQLGRKLVPRLLEVGYSVRAHYRTKEKADRWKPDFDELSRVDGAKPVFGDLLETGWIDDAVKDCDCVIHCAALVSMRPGRKELAHKINVEGTRAVVEACKFNNVKRLIYVSSIVTVGASENGRPIDETADFNLENTGIPYIDTKREAERIVMESNSPDFETVVVNPSIMIAPPDRELTERDLKKIPKRIPFYFDFGINLVSADDVVSGIISAIDDGVPGERYLLTGDNIHPDLAFELGYKYLGIKKPFIKLPHAALYLFALAVELKAKLKNKRPKFHRGLTRMTSYRFVYSNEKAKRELGFEPESIAAAVEKIVKNIPSLP
jgi:dihydroflavonol-4-reductase